MLRLLLPALLLLPLLFALDKPVSRPDFTIYHDQESLLSEVERIVERHAKFLHLEYLEAAAEDDGQYAVRIPVVTLSSDPRDEDGHMDKLRLLFSFGEHGREIITSEVALRVLDELGTRLEQVASTPAASSPSTMDELLRYYTIKIIPLENPRGRTLFEQGAFCERKNGRGVDINRNFPVDWGVKEPDYDPKEEFPGAKPFSEPEAFLLQRLAETFMPHVWIAVHSGMQAMFAPFDHKHEIPTTALKQLEILKQLNREHCDNQCAVGSGGKTVGYLAHGTVTDYMFVQQKVIFASTWEIFGDEKAAYEDCVRMFNPLTRDGMHKTVNQWSQTIYRLLELAPTHPMLGNLLRQAVSRAQDSLSTTLPRSVPSSSSSSSSSSSFSVFPTSLMFRASTSTWLLFIALLLLVPMLHRKTRHILLYRFSSLLPRPTTPTLSVPSRSRGPASSLTFIPSSPVPNLGRTYSIRKRPMTPEVAPPDDDEEEALDDSMENGRAGTSWTVPSGIVVSGGSISTVNGLSSAISLSAGMGNVLSSMAGESTARGRKTNSPLLNQDAAPP